MLKTKHVFQKCFYYNTVKNFHDSLNIVLILAPGREFFSAKCVKFPLKIME